MSHTNGPLIVHSNIFTHKRNLVTHGADTDYNYSSNTPADFVNGIFIGYASITGGKNVQTPTAAEIVAALGNCDVGSTFEFILRGTTTTQSYTLTAGTGVTISGTATVAQNNTKRFVGRVTVKTSGSEAVTIYSLGTSVF
jgi:hypothetical protein